MLIVTAFSGESFRQSARSLIGWMGELDNRLPHDLLLMMGAQTSMTDVMEIKSMADSVFSNVICVKQRMAEPQRWPTTANSLWRTTLEWMASEKVKQPFLWAEPDSIPMCPGWMAKLEAEYKACGKPIMGALFERPLKHINAVAIYPPNINQLNPYMKEAPANVPFDVVRPELTLNNAHVTKQIQRALDSQNKPYTFPTRDSLAVIRPETVLFHGSKTDDLIQRLREKRQPIFVPYPFQNRVKALIAKKYPVEPIPPGSTVFVQLGRAGDIINMLPIVQNWAKKNGKPYLMVAREFAPILDGVSYVKPHVTDLNFAKLNDALALAGKTFSKVIRTQIYGEGHRQPTVTPSWPQESWKEAGALDHFHDKSWRLTFDRRNPKREQALVARKFTTAKPKIVTNLTSAVSAPFPNGPTVLNAVQAEFGKDYEIVDIGKFRADRIYDLLGLYERAVLIVSIDTATMHLAAAVDTPLVALVNPHGWLGPQLRYNCLARIPYDKATPQAVIDAIKLAPGLRKETAWDKMARIVATPPKLVKDRLKLKQVTLWACCWSDNKDYLMRTLRVLRYCHSIVEWNKIVLFSYQKVPATGFPVELIQVPQMDVNSFNIWWVHNLPLMLPDTHCLSVHEDGFILNRESWDSVFLDYDYVGAVWAPDGTVGNGGFCLESARFLKAKAKLPFNERLAAPINTTLGGSFVTPSDDYVCRTHRKLLEEQGMRFAPREIASRFSTEMMDKHVKSWGWHGRHADPAKFARGWTLVENSEL